MPIDHDRLFKELLSSFFVEFVELFLPDLHRDLDPASVVFLDKEVFTDVTSGERHLADLVVRARCRERESFFLVHVETQSRSEPGFGARMFRYFARLHEKHALAVYPVALFSHARPRRREPATYRVAFPRFEVLRFRFRAIQLGRLDWRLYLGRANPVAAALMARMRIAPRDRPRVKAECLRLLATLRLDPARMRLISGFVDSYLQLTAREETLFRERIAALGPVEETESMEIVTSWMKQGLRQGRAEGRSEGRHEMAVEIVSRLLRHRFGRTPTGLKARVRRLSLRRLAALSAALLDFEGWTDCERWLGARRAGAAPGRVVRPPRHASRA